MGLYAKVFIMSTPVVEKAGNIMKLDLEKNVIVPEGKPDFNHE
jgi:hypothetical protein